MWMELAIMYFGDFKRCFLLVDMGHPGQGSRTETRNKNY